MLKMAGGIKNLTESYAYAVYEKNTYYDLWRAEQADRKKDREALESIMRSTGTIESTYKKEVEYLKSDNSILKKTLRKRTAGKRLWQVAAGALGGLLIYQSVK